MDLFDKARNKSLDPVTILKVFVTHEESLRIELLEKLKILYPNDNLNEDNLFGFLDQKIELRNTNSITEDIFRNTIVDNLTSLSNMNPENILNMKNETNFALDNAKLEYDIFIKEAKLFLSEQGIFDLDSDVYTIGYNKRVASDLIPFCLNEGLAGSMVAKAKSPTISNTEFSNNLSIPDVLKKEQSFNIASYEVLEQIKLPITKIDNNGIEYLTPSPIQQHEELNGNNILNGDIKISLHPVPTIRCNEFYLIDYDKNGTLKRFDFKNTTANKENVLETIKKTLSGIYVVEGLSADATFPIKGKSLFVHKLDYAKLKEYQESPQNIPSYEYEIDKNGFMDIKFDENFIKSYETYVTLNENERFQYGSIKKTHSLQDIALHALDAFSNKNISTAVDFYRDIQEKLSNLLKISVVLEKDIKKIGINDFNSQIFVIQNLLVTFLEKEMLSNNSSEIFTILTGLKEYINESTLDQTQGDLFNVLNNNEIKELSFDFFESIISLKDKREFKNFHLEVPRMYRDCCKTTIAKIDYAFNKILDYAHKANSGSLKNDRTHERRVLENISRVQKELGISPKELLEFYLNSQINKTQKNIEILGGIVDGFNENLDWQNSNDLPVININNLPIKPEKGKRIISYDLETGGLKSEVDGLSQFTAMVVDLNSDGNVKQRFFVDEYTNPEMNPIPVIGKDDNGYIFGNNSYEGITDTTNVIYGYTTPTPSKFSMLDNDTYHLWKTNNPSAPLYDAQGNNIIFLYPVQNVGAVDTHGIQNEQLVEKPAFREILSGVQQLFNSTDAIIGFNIINFDNNFITGLAKKNGLELNIDPNKNVDLKVLAGDLYTYTQVKNNVFEVWKNADKINLDHNVRYGGKTLNALSMMTLTSLEPRYVTGEEVHNACADTLITGNFAKNVLDISKYVLKEMKSLSKEAEINFKVLENKKENLETSNDSDLLLTLNIFKKIEPVHNNAIAHTAYERQINLLNDIDPILSNIVENVFGDKTEIDIKQKSKKELEIS
ncbi:MAG: hypothetical protein K2P52_05210 [Campylobacterales bacterium]|nr:hypothetical protein [Campylobacterales bacterium]